MLKHKLLKIHLHKNPDVDWGIFLFVYVYMINYHSFYIYFI